MKATKVVVTITVECLSFDAVAGLLGGAIYELDTECPEGRLVKDDGDTVSWSTTKTPVDF